MNDIRRFHLVLPIYHIYLVLNSEALNHAVAEEEPKSAVSFFASTQTNFLTEHQYKV